MSKRSKETPDRDRDAAQLAGLAGEALAATFDRATDPAAFVGRVEIALSSVAPDFVAYYVAPLKGAAEELGPDHQRALHAWLKANLGNRRRKRTPAATQRERPVIERAEVVVLARELRRSKITTDSIVEAHGVAGLQQIRARCYDRVLEWQIALDEADGALANLVASAPQDVA